MHETQRNSKEEERYGTPKPKKAWGVQRSRLTRQLWQRSMSWQTVGQHAPAALPWPPQPSHTSTLTSTAVIIRIHTPSLLSAYLGLAAPITTTLNKPFTGVVKYTDLGYFWRVGSRGRRASTGKTRGKIAVIYYFHSGRTEIGSVQANVSD